MLYVLNYLRTQSKRRSSTVPLFTMLTNRQQVPLFTNLPWKYGTIRKRFGQGSPQELCVSTTTEGT